MEHPRKMDSRLTRIYPGGVPKEAKDRALKAKMGKKTRAAVVKLAEHKESDIGYKITDHKGTVLKHHKGAGRFEMK